MPRRISGPYCTCANWPSVTGTPMRAASGIARKSSSVFRYPLARTMYSASPSSSTEPPASRLPIWIACFTCASVTP